MVETAQVAQSTVDTRDHIGEVATHLFALQGYDATSIRDIAEAAGVTKPVLYYYFKSKENLFVTLIHEAYEFFYEALEKIIDGPGDFEDRLHRVTQLYFELGQEYEDTVRLLFMTAFGPRRNVPQVDIFQFEEKHFEYLGRLFQEGIGRGSVRDIEIERIIILYLGALSIYIQNQLFTEKAIPENVVEIIEDIVFHGIGGEK